MESVLDFSLCKNVRINFAQFAFFSFDKFYYASKVDQIKAKIWANQVQDNVN